MSLFVGCINAIAISSAIITPGIDRRSLRSYGVAPVSRSMAPWMFGPLPPAALFKRNFGILGRPTARRPHGVRGMHCVGKQHRFIIAESVKRKVSVTLDKSLLLRGIKLARDHLRLAIFQLQPCQELDQRRTGVAHAIGLLDPLAHRGAGPWRQRLRHPSSFQPVLLRCRQFAGAAY